VNGEAVGTMAPLLPFALLGAVCGLDVVSFPQAMISRPLVAATASGALAGRVGAGLLVGAALELIALETLPFGASRYPEWGSAAVVAGALSAIGTPGRPGAITVSILAGLATAWIGGWTMIALRRLNAVRARRHQAALNSGSASTVVGLQLSGLVTDGLRGAALTLLMLAVFRPIAGMAVSRWEVDGRTSRAVVVGVAAAVAGAAVWKVFHSAPGTRALFGVGLLGGCLVLVLR
jgi:mannose/fructose/N-acetylgalactosamine-specific phosphotransferase system component IIC